MSVVVNDPANLPINIMVVYISSKRFIKFLNEIVIRNDIGVKRNDYFVINTRSMISWLQPNEELQLWHRFLYECRTRGFSLIMFKEK